MSLVALDNVSYSYPGGKSVLDGISASADAAAIIAIAGPNGAGKSTLLDVIAGQKTPASGRCSIRSKDAHGMPRKELCRQVAHVPQQIPAGVPFTVEEVVLTGRIPYRRGLYENDEDRAAMEQAIRQTRLEQFRERRFDSLSGGEKQRVLIAAALCQQAPILLLDEPGAHLDPENETRLWSLFRELKGDGYLILVVTHHLALAAQNSDRVWLLDRGKLVADAPPCDALRPDRLEAVFHVPFHWHDNGEGRVFLTYGH